MLKPYLGTAFLMFCAGLYLGGALFKVARVPSKRRSEAISGTSRTGQHDSRPCTERGNFGTIEDREGGTKKEAARGRGEKKGRQRETGREESREGKRGEGKKPARSHPYTKEIVSS